MIISTIKQELAEAKNPVVKSLHHNTAFRVLVIGFKKGMLMKSHTAKWPSKLTVLEGAVNYVENDSAILLQQYHEKDIQVNVPHSVEAAEDSLCLLTQSNE